MMNTAKHAASVSPFGNFFRDFFNIFIHRFSCLGDTFVPWSARTAEILQKFTSNERIGISAKFFDGGQPKGVFFTVSRLFFSLFFHVQRKKIIVLFSEIASGSSETEIR